MPTTTTNLQPDLFQHPTGTVYLLHFYSPIDSRQRNQHYIGYTKNITQRLLQHRRKRKGSNRVGFTRLAAKLRIPFILAQTWEGDRALEKKLKQQKNARRFCPVCQPGYEEPIPF